MIEDCHTNLGRSNEDSSVQKEFFVRVNGPPVHCSGSFIQKIVQKLSSGQYEVWDQNGNLAVIAILFLKLQAWRNSLTSQTIQCLMKTRMFTEPLIPLIVLRLKFRLFIVRSDEPRKSVTLVMQIINHFFFE
jgi:hypothetical protein